jgi:hypothetical protein
MIHAKKLQKLQEKNPKFPWGPKLEALTVFHAILHFDKIENANNAKAMKETNEKFPVHHNIMKKKICIRVASPSLVQKNTVLFKRQVAFWPIFVLSFFNSEILSQRNSRSLTCLPQFYFWWTNPKCSGSVTYWTVFFANFLTGSRKTVLIAFKRQIVFWPDFVLSVLVLKYYKDTVVQ